MDLKTFEKDGFVDDVAAGLAKSLQKTLDAPTEVAPSSTAVPVGSLGPNWSFENNILSFCPPRSDPVESSIIAINLASLLRPSALDKELHLEIFGNCVEKIQLAQETGAQVVIFANQPEVGRASSEARRQSAIKLVQSRLTAFLHKFEKPVEVYISCHKRMDPGSERFRLPGKGLWEEMLRHRKGELVELSSSFFIGGEGQRINEENEDDRVFAQAVGLEYFPAKEFFAD